MGKFEMDGSKSVLAGVGRPVILLQCSKITGFLFKTAVRNAICEKIEFLRCFFGAIDILCA